MALPLFHTGVEPPTWSSPCFTQFGGVYLDLDVLLLRDMAPLLRAPANPGGGGGGEASLFPGFFKGSAPASGRQERGGASLTLAHEGIDGTIGAGNALMLASRNASLLRAWYGRYRAGPHTHTPCTILGALLTLCTVCGTGCLTPSLAALAAQVPRVL